MRIRKFLSAVTAVMLFGMLLAACGGATPAAAPTAAPAAAPTTAPAAAAPTTMAEPTGMAEPTAAAATGGTPDKATLQLKWVTQAQFAGYYAALDQGYYKDENLDLTIRPGGPDIAPEQVVAGNQAEFGIDWLANLLSVREQGTPLVNIAQVYTNAGMREISWKESNINSPADLKGKKVGIWFFGNEFTLLATLNKYGIDKDKDVTLVQQPFDMTLLLNKEVDAAAAMTYNELYQVLSAGHKIEELNIIDPNKEGTAMPEDGLFVREDWIKDAKNKDIAARFLRASFKGWAYCRDNAAACVDIMVKNGAPGGTEAQKWQMDEVNKLVWGDPINKDTKIGYLDPEVFKRSAETALKFGITKELATDATYTHEIWEMATKK
ncbi:MAG: ABC transporter substrate-binding protein [Chloroflexota bacterium]|nr:ABC transporter substrate-binding protein [Chloroflexota bacterium]